MSPEAEERIERRISELCRSIEKGFERVHEDVDELRGDMKALHLEAIPHRVRALEGWQNTQSTNLEGMPNRVRTLETWKDGLAARLWTFLLGCGVASVTAWIAVLIR